MKTLLITLTISFVSTLFGADDMSWVNEQIKAIKPKRKGVSESTINLIKDPFIFLEKNRTTHPKQKNRTKKSVSKKSSHKVYRPYRTKRSFVKTLKLYAIMNNTALINKTWYKLGDKIDGYKIIKVEYNKVVLKKGKHIKTLTTLTKKFKTTHRKK